MTIPTPHMDISHSPVARQRAILYARVSTDQQKKDNESLETQVEACERYAHEHCYDIVASFKEDFSGAFYERPCMLQVLELVYAGQVDVVLCTVYDRIAREPEVYYRLEAELGRHNVKLIAIKQPLSEDEAINAITKGMIVSYAAFERIMIKTRTLAGRRRLTQSGFWVMSFVPYGFRKNAVERKLVVCEEERDTVQHIFRLYAEEGLSLGGIAARLNEEGVTPPSFRDAATEKKSRRKNAAYFWSYSTVRKILTDPVYKDDGWAFTKQYKKTGKRCVLVDDMPRETWIKLPVPEAIIPTALWEKAQEKMGQNQQYLHKRPKRTYTLRGKLMCDCETCGHAMVGYPNSKKNLKNYRCVLSNCRKASEERRCSNHISALKAEPTVWQTIREVYLNPERFFAEHGQKQSVQQSAFEKRHEEILTARTKNAAKLKRLEAAYLDGVFDLAAYKQHKEEIVQVDRDLAAEDQKNLRLLMEQEYVEKAVATMRDMYAACADMFDNADEELQQKVIDLLVEKVVLPVDKEKPLEIYLRVPLVGSEIGDYPPLIVNKDGASYGYKGGYADPRGRPLCVPLRAERGAPSEKVVHFANEKETAHREVLRNLAHYLSECGGHIRIRT